MEIPNKRDFSAKNDGKSQKLEKLEKTHKIKNIKKKMTKNYEKSQKSEKTEKNEKNEKKHKKMKNNFLIVYRLKKSEKIEKTQKNTKKPKKSIKKHNDLKSRKKRKKSKKRIKIIKKNTKMSNNTKNKDKNQSLLEFGEEIEKDIFLSKQGKKTTLFLKNDEFQKKGKIPKIWKHLISKNDPSIILINKKGLNVMIIIKNGKIEALRSVCPHMGVNNMWSKQKSNEYKCWAHGNIFKSGKDLKKYKVIKKNTHVEISIPDNSYSFFGGKSNCDTLRDIEDLV